MNISKECREEEKMQLSQVLFQYSNYQESENWLLRSDFQDIFQDIFRDTIRNSFRNIWAKFMRIERIKILNSICLRYLNIFSACWTAASTIFSPNLCPRPKEKEALRPLAEIKSLVLFAKLKEARGHNTTKFLRVFFRKIYPKGSIPYHGRLESRWIVRSYASLRGQCPDKLIRSKTVVSARDQLVWSFIPPLAQDCYRSPE
jgi:hypothetical protein